MTIYNLQDDLEHLQNCTLAYGHFSTIHPGHIRYLNYAIKQGNSLVIALRGDKYINGINKFRFSQIERANALDTISIKSNIICLTDNEIDLLTEILKPEILVFGKEFEISNDFEVKNAIKFQEKKNRKVLFHAGDVNYATTELLGGSENEIYFKRKNEFIKAIKRYNLDKDTLLNSIKSWNSSRILVIGDSMIDEYAACEPLGLSAEAPVIVVKELEKKNYLGGAAIVASHIKSLGASCEFISVVGNDENASLLKKKLHELDINCSLIIDPSRPTTYKKRYVVENQKLFRVSILEEKSINKNVEDKILNALEKSASNVDGIVISDFVYGVITERVLEKVISLSKEFNIKIFGDIQCSSQVGSILKFRNFSLLCPNEKEARIALDDKDSGLEKISKLLIEKANSEKLIMKLGSNGFITYEKDQFGEYYNQSFPALSANPLDVAGAGDSLLACMATGLCSGQSMICTASIGCIIAAITVETMGNIPINRSTLESKLNSIFS